MNTKDEISEQTIKVPSDMLIDVLSIILKEDFKYEIIQVLENKSIAVLSIEIDNKQSRQAKAMQNIQNHLHAYNDYRFSENETLNWRES